MAINKVVYGNNTLIDLTSDTVTADKLMQGYTAHDASGTIITGTATGGGGGSVTQDQDGFIVLPPDGDGGGSTGGLEYESGTWTPTNDTESYTISFANTHTETPFFYMISDVGEYYDTTYSCHNFMYWSPYLLTGEPLHFSPSASYYALGVYRNRGTSATMFSSSYVSTTSVEEISIYMTNTEIIAKTSSSSYYWRAGRTYKWIAVWAPTT